MPQIQICIILITVFFVGKQIDGIWHTGIVVFGKEYFYGGMGGIECCAPVSDKKPVFNIYRCQMQ